jgi:hypothetical protein
MVSTASLDIVRKWRSQRNLYSLFKNEKDVKMLKDKHRQ